MGARAAGVAEIVDPALPAVASLAATYAKYPNARGILPAMGYGEAQIRDLEATIEAADCDAVVSDADRPDPGADGEQALVRARYALRERTPGGLEAEVRRVLGR